MEISWLFIFALFLFVTILFRKSEDDERDNVHLLWLERKEFEKLSLNGVKRLKCVSQGKGGIASKHKDEIPKKVGDKDHSQKKIRSKKRRKCRDPHPDPHDPDQYRAEIIWRHTFARHGKSLVGYPIEVKDIKRYFFTLQPEKQSCFRYRSVSRFEKEYESINIFVRSHTYWFR